MYDYYADVSEQKRYLLYRSALLLAAHMPMRFEMKDSAPAGLPQAVLWGGQPEPGCTSSNVCPQDTFL